tara:strand:+ start:394 stop:618 length:225 start_codon:yes stop_codon:yes gene_type:complete
MKANSIFLLLTFSLFILASFLLLKLNIDSISIDFLFVELEINKGKLVLLSFCSGLIFTIFIEVLYFLLKKKNQE